MKRKKSEANSLWRDKYLIAALLLFILQIAIIFRNILLDRPYSFFWYCSFTPILFGIAFYKRNNQAIKGLINVGLIVQLLFLLDIIAVLFFGAPMFGLFSDGYMGVSYTIVVIAMHATVLSALFCTYTIKPSKQALYYSFALVILMFVVTWAVTPADMNINYLHYAGGLKSVSPLYYSPILWPLFAMILIILPTHAFQYVLYKMHRKVACKQ